MTAYSNFGTALAGYIVERISRQSYADYVHEHIFEPLDMRHTALLPDLSDNPYVVEKRKEVKGYTRDGRLIGEAPYLIEMYPAGRATGTLEDFKAFAQALLQKKTLLSVQRLGTPFIQQPLTILIAIFLPMLMVFGVTFIKTKLSSGTVVIQLVFHQV